MGARISHMNVYALSTLVQAEEVDIENLLRTFEGKKQQFPFIKYKGKDVENIPMRANSMEERYKVDALEIVLLRQEEEQAARKAAEEAAEAEEKAKIDAVREVRSIAVKSASNVVQKKKKVEMVEPREQSAGLMPLLAEIMPSSLPGFNSRLAEEYEAQFTAQLAPELDTQFKRVEDSNALLDPGSALSLTAEIHLVADNDDDDDDDLTGAGLDDDFALVVKPDALSLDGNSVVGSIVSVAGGGTVRSTTSVTSDMRQADSKVKDFYHEVKIEISLEKELPASYLVKIDDLLKLCRASGFHDSDIDLMESMFRLVDARGFEEADIRHVLVPFALCVGSNNGSVASVVRLMFSIFDRAKTDVVEKTQMLKMFNLCNEALLYVGDKPLAPAFIVDLVDSIFTTAGRLDGDVQWTEYVELIAEHPIIEMLIAPQYQGLARDKVFDEETLAEMKHIPVILDYSDKKHGDD